MIPTRLLGAAAALLACGVSAWAETNTVDVRTAGASGDGKTVETAVIQKALDECGKAGGGIVRFPPGTYLSQPLSLRGNTTVLFEAGATLKATDAREDFLKPGSTDAAPSFLPFISGKRLTNITITGSGTIDGSGARWWGPAKAAKANPTNSGYTLPRPRMIILSECKNVRVEKVTLMNSPTFHLVPEECEDVVIDQVTITAPDDSPNTDGIDPSRSQRVRITRCRIGVGDDNIAIKSGRRLPGREAACEDITISDCVFLHGHGVSIGSETVGGVRKVLVRDCTFDGTENGLRIKSPRGKGGLIENIAYINLTLTNVDPAIVVTAYYPKIPLADAARPMTPETPIIRNLLFKDITATATAEAGMIVGLPECVVSNVVLQNVRLNAAGQGLLIRNAKGVSLTNTQVTAGQGEPFLLQDAEVAGLPEKTK